jgi:hypothetical protein
MRARPRKEGREVAMAALAFNAGRIAIIVILIACA